MLLQFKVRNFMSFRDEVILDMMASNTDELKENVIEEAGNAVLKTATIFGANASGKSNVVKAITSAIMTIRESEHIQLGDSLFRIIPFKLDSLSRFSVTTFEFTFIAEGTKHVYGFSADTKIISEEYLLAYYSQRPTTIFHRSNDEYKFPSDKTILQELTKRNIPNRLFLSTATAWNYERTRAPFIWLSKMIDTYDTNSWVPDFNSLMKKEQRDFTNELLRIADINIADYHVKKVDLPKEQIEVLKGITLFREMLDSKQTFNGDFYSTQTIHKIIDKNGDISTNVLDLVEESIGTQILFYMSVYLRNAFKQGKIMVVDEFENSLHPLIVEELIRMFHDSAINSSGAQLIFTTHNTNILSLDLFRRDQILFVEKDQNTAVSEMYSLSDLSVRRDENIRNGYIHGRYGGIPNILRGGTL